MFSGMVCHGGMENVGALSPMHSFRRNGVDRVTRSGRLAWRFFQQYFPGYETPKLLAKAVYLPRSPIG
jgi:hypothetical protein